MKRVCEIRVRPVVRYVVTEFTSTEYGQSSVLLGEFDNAGHANLMAKALADQTNAGRDGCQEATKAVLEEAPYLSIDWSRAPEAPPHETEWKLSWRYLISGEQTK